MRISDWSSDVCSSDLQRDAGEAHGRIGAGAADQEAGLAGVVIGGGGAHGDLARQRRDFAQQFLEFTALGGIAEAGDKLDGHADLGDRQRTRLNYRPESAARMQYSA